MNDAFEKWIADLEKRHLAELAFSEVARGLRALSSTYVERRRRIGAGGVFDGAGKRAAFALFYAPLHYLLVRAIVHALPRATERIDTIVDLGCGTGAAGAAWAGGMLDREAPARRRAPSLIGIDRHPWALAEAARTYRAFGLRARTRKGDVAAVGLPREPVAIVAAFTMNELADADRDALLTRLVDRARRGDRLLIVEPIAGAVARWWDRWRTTIEAAGGRADEWRFRVDLPPIVAKLDRAAGLDHRELTARSLWSG